jgi:hypothetical protein
MRLAWVGAALLLVAACITDPKQGRQDAAIRVLCECQAPPLPKTQELCVDMLTKQGPTLTDSCIRCILDNSNSCPVVQSVCENVCQPSPPPQGVEKP